MLYLVLIGIVMYFVIRGFIKLIKWVSTLTLDTPESKESAKIALMMMIADDK